MFALVVDVCGWIACRLLCSLTAVFVLCWFLVLSLIGDGFADGFAVNLMLGWRFEFFEVL